jgi:glycerophosphoryl diester phosphodiesterase
MKFWDSFKNKEHLLIAHRGARSLRAENTMSAFEKALGKSDFIELDVGFSRDGVAVIIHDDTLERTTNAKELSSFQPPYNVVDYSYEELLELDFSSWFLKTDPFGTIKDGLVTLQELQDLPIQRIPTLKEVLSFLKENHFKANIEIKDASGTPFDKVAAKEVVKLIEEFALEDEVIISSFNHSYLKQVYELNPHIATGALQENENPKDLTSYLQSLHVTSYHPDFEITSKELVEEVNSIGLHVNVFTVNKKEDIQKLFSWGVKGVFSDFV